MTTFASDFKMKALKVLVALAMLMLPLGPFCWGQAFAAETAASLTVASPSYVALGQSAVIGVNISPSGSTGAGATQCTLSFKDYSDPSVFHSIGTWYITNNQNTKISFTVSQAKDGAAFQARQTEFKFEANAAGIGSKSFYIDLEPAYRTVSLVANAPKDGNNTVSLDIDSLNATYGRAYSYNAANSIVVQKLPKPTYTNYEFAGWFASYDKESGEYSDEVTEETIFTGTKDGVLYAKWTGKTREILLSSQGAKGGIKGTLSQKSIIATYGQPLSELSKVLSETRCVITEGKELKYLRRFTTYTGEVIDPDTVFDSNFPGWSSDYLVLYAEWGDQLVSLNNASISGLSKDGYSYTGKSVCPTVTVTLGKKTLVEGKDFRATYSNNVAIGTDAQITIVGIGDYTGSVSAKFEITNKPCFQIGERLLTGSSDVYAIPFTGSDSMTVATKLLTDATTVEYFVYGAGGGVTKGATVDENGVVTVTEVGSYKVVAKAAAGNKYIATPSEGAGFTLRVTMGQIVDVKTKLSSESVAYTGKKSAPKVTVKAPDGSKLVKGRDYEVKYNGDCVKIGEYTMYVVGIGNYEGTALMPFKVVPAAPVQSTPKYYKSQSQNGKTYGVYLVKWGKVANATGYQVRRVVGSNSQTTTFGASATSKYFGWQKGKTVKVQVRAICKTSGKKYYSAWTTKTVKVK